MPRETALIFDGHRVTIASDSVAGNDRSSKHPGKGAGQGDLRRAPFRQLDHGNERGLLEISRRS